MKYFLSGKFKKNITILLAADSAHRVVKIKSSTQMF